MNLSARHKKFFIIFLVIGLLVYSPIFLNGFVWDDFPFILNNPDFHPMNIQGIFGRSMFNYGLFYRPISSAYFALIYSIFEQKALLYHFIQLTLHVISTSLVFICFLLFLPETIAFFLAILFLVHPINVESVAYISATTSQLYLIFGISAFLLGVRKQTNHKLMILIFFLLLLAALTKESGIFFLFLILLYRFLFKIGRLKEFTFIGIGTFTIYFILRILIGGVKSSAALLLIPINNLSLPERLINIPAIVIYYIKTLIFPKDLSIWQIWVVKNVNLTEFIIPLFVCFVLISLLVYLFHLLNSSYTTNKQKIIQKLLFFTGWYAMGMVLIIQIFPLEMTVADRWFYFAFVGALGMVGIGLGLLHQQLRQHKRLAITTAILIISLFSIRTFARTLDWKDNVTLHEHDLLVDPENPILLDDVAKQRYSSGKIEDAIAYEKKSISLDPNIVNLTTLGTFYQNSGQYQNAISAYTDATQAYTDMVQKHKPTLNKDTLESYVMPGIASATKDLYTNLAYSYYLADMPDKAVQFINEKALIKFPSSARLYFLLGVAEYKANNKQKALEAIDKAYQLVSSADFRQMLRFAQYQINNDIPLNLTPE